MKKPPLICPKCKKEMDNCEMEAIIAPPAPTMYLTTWSCSSCREMKKKKADPKKDLFVALGLHPSDFEDFTWADLILIVRKDQKKLMAVHRALNEI